MFKIRSKARMMTALWPKLAKRWVVPRVL